MENTSSSLVTFKISNELYGINIMDVREIVNLLEVTPIPNSPSFVDGVINLRGEIIPTVDLSKRFHFSDSTSTNNALRSIIIIKVGHMVIGVMIDQVNRVINIDPSDIQPPPQVITGVGAEFIDGVVKTDDTLLILLNIHKLFNEQELLQLSGK